ncbi:MAG TPA: HAMP domain-containing protein, partial [Calditrichaeota bacterium]|nr:HAMP domain-containing protein [Calditrichota bacterium]
LLSVSLIPLILIIALQRFSFQVTGNKVTSDIRKVLDDYAYYNMESILHQFNMNLDLNVRLLEALIKIQADRMEEALRGKKAKRRKGGAKSPDEFLDTITLESVKNLNDKRHSNNVYPFPVDFFSENIFIVKGASRKKVDKDLAAFRDLTEVFKKIYHKAPQIIYWQHVSLESGIIITYPKGIALPKLFDPRKRDWYKMAKKAGGLIWSEPYVDASTHKPMLTVAKPIYRSDGSFAGVTGIDIHLPLIFRWMHLNPDWAEGAERMLLTSHENKKKFKILARSSMEDSLEKWNQPLKLETISSEDTTEFNAFLNELFEGKSGVRIMRYKGEKAIWVYGGGKGRVIALLLVPYKNMTELADRTEEFLWKKNTQWMRYSALFLALLLITEVIIVIKLSKKFTSPILDLANAGQKLAGGNFDAHVDIQSGDELQQLGDIFNRIGPKLKEHQKMQQSLVLAGAIQQRLLPKDVPHIPGFDIAGLCRFSDETGGDYYDFIEFEKDDSGKISIIVGDVSGHGISAALMMASARAIVRSNIRHFTSDLSRIMYEFNNELTADSETEKFMTLFLGLLDTEKRTIIWTSGGHDPAIRYHAMNGKYEELSTQGIPVGFLSNMNFETAGPLKLNKGDIVLIGTDGIWETEREDEEMFGKDRLSQVVNNNKDKSAEEICRIIVDSVIDFCKPRKPEDDITVVIIKVL